MLIMAKVLLAITIIATIAAFTGAYVLRMRNLKRRLELKKLR